MVGIFQADQYQCLLDSLSREYRNVFSTNLRKYMILVKI